MSDAYNAAVAALTPDAIGKMSQQEAGHALERLTMEYRGVKPIAEVSGVKPKNGIEASSKLKALHDSAEWRDRFNAGDPAAVKELNEAIEMVSKTPASEFAKAGVEPVGHIDSGPGAMLRDQISAIRDMVAKGWAPSAIDDIVSDKKPTLIEHENGKLMLERFRANQQLTDALLAGNREAQWLHRDLCWATGCYDGT
jgi:hypothetical protein